MRLGEGAFGRGGCITRGGGDGDGDGGAGGGGVGSGVRMGRGVLVGELM